MRPGPARLTSRELIDGLYQGFFGRAADEAGLAHHLRALESGEVDLAGLIHALRWSPESALAWLASPAAGRGQALWASREAARLRGGPAAAGEEQIYFLHIMKTAGTSLVNAMAARSGPRLCLSQVFLDHIPFLPEPLLRGAALVAGHLGTGVIPILAPDAKVVTVIREPVSRVLSHYSHLCQDPAVLSHTAQLTLSDFIHLPRWRPLVENFQARHLVHDVGVARAWLDFSPPEALADMGPPFPEVDALPLQFLLDYSPLPHSEAELLQAALARLDSLDLVGVTDRLEDFYAQLVTHWGQTAEGGLPRDNVGVATLGAEEVAEDLRAEILAANAVDAALYQRAGELAGRGWRRPGTPGGSLPGGNQEER
ncbi:MAG TPA: hypothetical protein VNF50_04830 [Acidimicrobiales bacterium]|nr:hypothetical protein [Acidimicrobiales bacterium]